MTSESNALHLAQSAFEAVCKERDEALAKLSTVNRWVEKNLSSGFIDSLTHLQNLECLAYDWHGRLVETIRERDEAREQLEAMREVVKACMAAMPVGNVQTHTPENLAARIGDLASALASETSENEAMREAIKDAYYALAYVYNDGTGSCAFPFRTDDDLCSENRFHHVKDALDALKPLLP